MSEQVQAGDAADILARIVDDSSPSRLISCGETARQVARRWLAYQPEAHWLELAPAAPQDRLADWAGSDLALISETLHALDRQRGLELLGLLRNYGTQRIAVLVETEGEWTFRDFIGLGFVLHAELGTAQKIYSYNLDTYNPAREWNNPRFWANPEMWDKARW